MTISKDDRISISKKLISIPKNIASANNVKAILNVNLVPAQNADNANKSISDNYTTLINEYQIELTTYDGNIRTQLLEQNILDSGNHVIGNFFNQNQPTHPTPSLPKGIWVNFTPCSFNLAIGKNYSEGYSATTKEQDLIDIINTHITNINTYSAITRSSGQSCGASGTCSLPSYTTEPTCVGATPTPGVWTAGGDIIADEPLIQAESSALITAVNNWKTFCLNTQTIINAIIDSNSDRTSNNTTTSGQITTTSNSITSWQNLPTFDTGHGQTTCTGFNAYNVTLLQETKYRADGLTVLTNAIAQRVTDISARTTALNSATYLGSITQAVDGTITTATGLYGSRFRIIDQRLNLMSGTLPAVLSIQSGKNAQDQSIASNTSGLLAYADIIKASQFSAPSIGTANIHVKDGSIFGVSDSVYVIADGQEEISATILAINVNLITLSTIVPAKYSDSMFARLYKVL